MSAIRDFMICYNQKKAKQLCKVSRQATYIGNRFDDINNIIENIYSPDVGIELSNIKIEKNFDFVYRLEVSTSKKYSNKQEQFAEILYKFYYSIINGLIKDEKSEVETLILELYNKFSSIGMVGKEEDFCRKILIKIEYIKKRFDKNSSDLQMFSLMRNSPATLLGGNRMGGGPSKIDVKLIDRKMKATSSLFLFGGNGDDEGGTDGNRLLDEKKDPMFDELEFGLDVRFDHKHGGAYVFPCLNGKDVNLHYMEKSHQKIFALLQERLKQTIVLRVDINSHQGPNHYTVYDVLPEDKT